MVFGERRPGCSRRAQFGGNHPGPAMFTESRVRAAARGVLPAEREHTMLTPGFRHALEEQAGALEALAEIEMIMARCGIWFRDNDEKHRRRLRNARRYIARSSWNR